MAQPIIGDDPRTLVSTDWLAAHLNDPDLRILDASYYLPDMGRDALAEYEAGHIPGARFFDIDEISDARSSLPHMAAPVEKFMSRMRAMGVGDGHQVVVYDGVGVFSAARVWWNFRLMGKTDVAVLNGGLPKWKAEGREVEDMPPILRDRHMTAQRQAHLVKDVTQVASASKLGRLADPRRPQPRAVQGRGTRVPARPSVGAYPRLHQRALRDASERRQDDEGRRRAARRVRSGGRRRVETHDHLLRIGRDGGDPDAGAGTARQQGRVAL
jgi:thiosulfate/3-mercaptopyruvate sulfurtransferase